MNKPMVSINGDGEKIYSKEDLDEAVQHAISRRDVKELKDGMDILNGRFDKLEVAMAQMFVTQEAFRPVRNIVYGMVTIILTGVVGAILTLVVK